MKGSREGFTEDIETNIGIIKRAIKDEKLTIEDFIVGKRSQTRLAVICIDDIVDKDIPDELKSVSME